MTDPAAEYILNKPQPATFEQWIDQENHIAKLRKDMPWDAYPLRSIFPPAGLEREEQPKPTAARWPQNRGGIYLATRGQDVYLCRVRLHAERLETWIDGRWLAFVPTQPGVHYERIPDGQRYKLVERFDIPLVKLGWTPAELNCNTIGEQDNA